MMSAQQLASAIADFYAEDSSRWTQHFEARDSSGKPTRAADPAAVQWCMSGAVDKIYPRFCAHGAWMDLRSMMPGGTVVGFNDNPNRTVAEVIAQLRQIASTSQNPVES